MPAALAHEQHHPIVRRGDEAMGAAKLPRGVQDRGRHSNLRLEAATLTKFTIGSTAMAIGVPSIPDRRDTVACAAIPVSLTMLSSHHRMGFRTARQG
jgi:hypothetical protein